MLSRPLKNIKKQLLQLSPLQAYTKKEELFHRSHQNIEVEQHLARIVVGCETTLEFPMLLARVWISMLVRGNQPIFLKFSTKLVQIALQEFELNEVPKIIGSKVVETLEKKEVKEQKNEFGRVRMKFEQTEDTAEAINIKIGSIFKFMTRLHF